MPTFSPLVLNNRELTIPKAIVSPDLGARTVLTNEPWDYVDLSLARNKQDSARFFWQQAREFYQLADRLRLQSAPLLLYYAFMNATKALLSAKGRLSHVRHGVKQAKSSATSRLEDLTIGVEVMDHGILPALSDYYKESEVGREHTLSDIFFNLPFIHRTYCLTNEPIAEMFIPMVEPTLVYEEGTNKVFFTARLTGDFPSPRFCSSLPAVFAVDSVSRPSIVVSSKSVEVSSVATPTSADCTVLANFLRSLREDVYYINGAESLWYVKGLSSSRKRISRQSTTLTLAAMHRLSEESRYHPERLEKCLEGENNWLVSEFIKMSGVQFIDEIASEITGKQFLRPNIRSAK